MESRWTKVTRWVWENFTRIATIFGWIMGFGVPAWYGAATNWVQQYGPIGWVACGLAGLLAVSLAFWITSYARAKWAQATIARSFYRSADRVNPMDGYFHRRRIRLEDLLPPGTGIVYGKTFEDCDLVGPLNIALFGGYMESNVYETVDHIMIDNAAADRTNNVRVFRDCKFIRCKFYYVSVFVLESNYQGMTALGGTNWITLPPPSQPLEPPQPSRGADQLGE